MSEAISTISPGGLEDRRATIGSSQFARVMSVSASWTRLRMSFRMTLTDSGANITSGPRIVLGLMSAPSAGVANGPLSASTSHFFGMRTVAATWTRNAGVYYTAAGMWRAVRRVGTTDTTSIHADIATHSAMESTGRWPYILEITKGSPNYTYGFICPTTITAQDFSETEMVRTLEPDTLAQVRTFIDSLRGSSINLGGTLACDEGADGTLDSIVFGWDRTASLVNMSDIHYKVLA